MIQEGLGLELVTLSPMNSAIPGTVKLIRPCSAEQTIPFRINDTRAGPPNSAGSTTPLSALRPARFRRSPADNGGRPGVPRSYLDGKNPWSSCAVPMSIAARASSIVNGPCGATSHSADPYSCRKYGYPRAAPTTGKRLRVIRKSNHRRLPTESPLPTHRTPQPRINHQVPYAEPGTVKLMRLCYGESMIPFRISAARAGLPEL